jgi:hypothetical protein
MDTSPLEQLLPFVFTDAIAQRFSVIAVEPDGQHRLTITLEERPMPPNIPNTRIESKGFAPERTIRDRAVTLKVRCRRWRNADTGAEITVPLDLTAPGTTFLREFGDFLKALDRNNPHRHRERR